MTQEIFFRKLISVGHKSPNTDSTYGEGFNYWIEIGLRLSPEAQSMEIKQRISEVVKRIDHRALGLDVTFDFVPTAAQLCVYLARELCSVCGDPGVKVRLFRGDDLAAAVD